MTQPDLESTPAERLFPRRIKPRASNWQYIATVVQIENFQRQRKFPIENQQRSFKSKIFNVNENFQSKISNDRSNRKFSSNILSLVVLILIIRRNLLLMNCFQTVAFGRLLIRRPQTIYTQSYTPSRNDEICNSGLGEFYDGCHWCHVSPRKPGS